MAAAAPSSASPPPPPPGGDAEIALDKEPLHIAAPAIPVEDADVDAVQEALLAAVATSNAQLGKDGVALSEGEVAAFATRACLARYLVAHRQDVAAAVKGVLATLQWRRDTVPRPLGCPSCVEEPSTHCFEFVGHDRTGRPIIYGCPARATKVRPAQQCSAG